MLPARLGSARLGPAGLLVGRGGPVAAGTANVRPAWGLGLGPGLPGPAWAPCAGPSWVRRLRRADWPRCGASEATARRRRATPSSRLQAHTHSLHSLAPGRWPWPPGRGAAMAFSSSGWAWAPLHSARGSALDPRAYRRYVGKRTEHGVSAALATRCVPARPGAAGAGG